MLTKITIPWVTRLAKSQRILAVSSGGGHWTQLMRLREAFGEEALFFASVQKAYKRDVAPNPFFVVRDATRWNKLSLIIMMVQIFLIVVKVRPEVVVSTGAAPGYFALRFGKIFGARTVWVDSLANVDEMSLSGRLAKKYADIWLTQWSHLARLEGPYFEGRLL